MVYRGKLSKACERCRTRRLKCDLKPTPCGQCIRANSACSGYRDTSQLRFQHETKTITHKFMGLKTPEPRYLPISVTMQARTAFFTYYASSSCWDFLAQYYNYLEAPNLLVLAMEAASLAFLWHQTYSPTALLAARQRYTLALRLTNNMLQSRQEAVKDTTLVTTLLLDIFEKITTISQTTDDVSRGKSTKIAHLSGALVLVQLRGVQNFKEMSQVKILRRLDALCVSGSVTNELYISDTFVALRKHLEGLSEGQGTMAELAITISSTMINYGRLRQQSNNGIISNEECIALSIELERKLQDIEENLPVSAKATVKPVVQGHERVFGVYYHEYRHRNVCATRNMLRVARMDLNGALAEFYTTSSSSSLEDNGGNDDLAMEAMLKTTQLVNEVVASIPPYTRCEATGARGHGHDHTPRQQTDVYLLIFPLYSVGRAKGTSSEVRGWILKELRHIATHFNIRNADVVAEILLRREDIGVWEIYTMLGGCAFNS